MAESALYGQLLLAATAANRRLFRNNVGLFYTRDGRPIHCGLAVGSSDLIGITPRIITREMVGLTVGLFTAIEVKHAAPVRPEQAAFLAMVRQRGGIAGVVRSVEEALTLLGVTP
jgi:hypothetical protein